MIVFVGEAPGRLGADETEVPFHGDTAGRNFEDLLAFAGSKEALIASQGPGASFLFLATVIEALKPFLESRE